MGKSIQNNSIEHIYIHVPFCKRKCSYCSFFSRNKEDDFIKNYFQNMILELQYYSQNYLISPKTIYFGGGTPSTVDFSHIKELLNLIDLTKVEEITMEVNPRDINNEYVKKVNDSPINRISMGVQSFVYNELKILGRDHSAEDVFSAYGLLQKYFDNISLDFIYGLPTQKSTDLDFSISRFLKLQPQHISTYCLSLESDVKLFAQKEMIPDDKQVASFYYKIVNALKGGGYQQYEISNFAKSGCESKHNLSYWNHKNYLGIGASASGFLQNIRYSNPASFEQYSAMLQSENIPNDYEELDIQTLEKEYIFLHLRTIKGLNINSFAHKFNIDFNQKYKNKISNLLKEKYLKRNGNYISLTKKALFVSDEIFTKFM